jgi:hypothetical protein
MTHAAMLQVQCSPLFAVAARIIAPKHADFDHVLALTTLGAACLPILPALLRRIVRTD